MSEGPDPTAVRTAMWRALHVLIDDGPPVLDDTLALRIADPEDDWRARPDMDPERTRTNRASIVARARAAEDVVRDSGVEQYVVLGAGLDTFAQRQDGDVTVFEVDAPETQAWKRGRLSELGSVLGATPVLVPVDFEAGESWFDATVAAGLDSAVPTAVSMLGVTMYLTREAISETLRAAAALAPGSSITFSYSRPIEMAPAEIQSILRGAAEGAKASGHPWLSLLAPEEAVDLARDAGFDEVQVVTSADLHAKYFADRNDGLSPIGGEDLVVATVR